MSLGRVVLAPPERKELERRVRSRSLGGGTGEKSEGHCYVSSWSVLQ